MLELYGIIVSNDIEINVSNDFEIVGSNLIIDNNHCYQWFQKPLHTMIMNHWLQ